MPSLGMDDEVFEPTEPTFGEISYGTALDLSVVSNGVSYSLDDGTFCYWIGDDGLGMAPIHRLSERGPLQHGDTDRGFRLDPRIVRLVLDIVATSQHEFEQKRNALLQVFRPWGSPIKLKFSWEEGTYYLDCHYLEQMTMPSNDRIGWNQTVVVDLKASDPTFYNPTANIYRFNIGGSTDKTEVPTVIPMTVGAGTGTIYESGSLYNAGSIWAYPIIRINGPITSPVITSVNTGDKLDFTGTTVSAADYYDIDLRYGYKTVTDKSGANKIATLTSDSDLVSFHLGCNPDFVRGWNPITITGSATTEDTWVEFNWYTRYIGI